MSSHSKDQLAVTQAFNKRIQNHKQNTLLFLASISCSPLIEFFSCSIITFQKFQWNSQFCQFDCKSIYSVRLFSAQYVLTLPQNFHINYIFFHILSDTQCFHGQKSGKLTGLSLRSGGWRFPWLHYECSPRLLSQEKQKKNRTKRNPWLFDSPPTCCIYSPT